jgi:hypothetical protein
MDTQADKQQGYVRKWARRTLWFPEEWSYVFHTILRINNDYFSESNCQICYKGEAASFLGEWGIGTEFFNTI